MSAKIIPASSKNVADLNIAPSAVQIDFKGTLPNEKITALLGSVQRETTEAVHGTPVIFITSTYNSEGAGQVALDLALNNANAGHKTLLLDMAPRTTHTPLQSLRVQTPASLNDIASNPNSGDTPFLQIEGQNLFYAKLASFQNLDAILEQLRALFDFIIIASEDAIASQSVENYAHLTDGGILVIQAQRTRIPVIKELKTRIENSGGKIIGTVLNERRQHIPNFLYSLLFKR